MTPDAGQDGATVALDGAGPGREAGEGRTGLETHPGGFAGWQPIETAPRDGSPVLLFSPDAADQVPTIGWWLQAENPVEDGWYDYWNETAPPLDADPTHWQPLPGPPPAVTHDLRGSAVWPRRTPP